MEGLGKLHQLYIDSLNEFEAESQEESEEQIKKHAGISKDFFMLYFADHQDSYAIKFKAVFKLETPKSLMCLGNNIAAPQSYTYITETTEELCNKLGIR